MRWVAKPRLACTRDPERAAQVFERSAPFLFSKPKGMRAEPDGQFLRITCGDPIKDRAILYIHGGAFMAGSPRSYRAMGARLAKRTGATVFLVAYPLLQNAPFPAAPNAVLAGWEKLLSDGWQPHQIVIAGDSAGGNLVFSLLARVLAKGQRPAGVLAFSPWGDLTLSGDSITSNAACDPFIPVARMQEAVSRYLCGADPKDPIASPIFAQFYNPPPVLIQVGGGEVLLSDSKMLAEKTSAELDVWRFVPHVWQIFDGRLPEANAAMRKAAIFVHTSFERAKR
jgi:acetyl esterase/lipase